MSTASQQTIYRANKTICLGLGIPQVTLAHKKLKGTVSAPSGTGNVIYQGPGPVTAFDFEYQSTTLVYWVSQPFLRGEQQRDMGEFAIQSNQELYSQIAGIDDTGATIAIEDDDFIIDGQVGALQSFWRVVDPVWSPDYSFVTFMAERQR